MESLYELWGKRNPEWEERYQDSVISVFSDYGKGVNQYQDVRGKIYGAGYEVFILAFFIGLYSNKTKPLVEDRAKRKHFGWAISNWGTGESRLGRTQYPRLREYMFAALVARTDVDYLALDKGEITPRKVVDELITKMEEYANYGFDFMQEKWSKTLIISSKKLLFSVYLRPSYLSQKMNVRTRMIMNRNRWTKSNNYEISN